MTLFATTVSLWGEKWARQLGLSSSTFRCSLSGQILLFVIGLGARRPHQPVAGMGSYRTAGGTEIWGVAGRPLLFTAMLTCGSHILASLVCGPVLFGGPRQEGRRCSWSDPESPDIHRPQLEPSELSFPGWGEFSFEIGIRESCRMKELRRKAVFRVQNPALPLVSSITLKNHRTL